MLPDLGGIGRYRHRLMMTLFDCWASVLLQVIVFCCPDILLFGMMCHLNRSLPMTILRQTADLARKMDCGHAGRLQIQSGRAIC